jgi:hypothetical protein
MWEKANERLGGVLVLGDSLERAWDADFRAERKVIVVGNGRDGRMGGRKGPERMSIHGVKAREGYMMNMENEV